MSWGVDVYLQLRKDRWIKEHERGALPLPEDLIAALQSRAAEVEQVSRSPHIEVAAWMLTEPAELRALAGEVRRGSERGRAYFRQEFLELIEVKRGRRPASGVTAHLPADVLAPFHAAPDRAEGEHSRRLRDEIAETRELRDPALRR